MKKVLVGGVFDLLHYGHIVFLKKAKSLGDKIVIALESDANVRRLKGPKRPIHNQKMRHEMLESLSFVDEIIDLKGILKDKDYEKLVLSVKPHIIAVTEGDPVKEKKVSHALKVDASVVVIPVIRTHSTTQIAKLIGLE